MSQNVRPNDQCPCWSGKKYKKCCSGKIDWNAILRSGQAWDHLISIRGRNILFAEEIAGALQLDKFESPPSLEKYKAAFTESAVRQIYEAIPKIWPPTTDITALLERTRSDVAGLYIGDYSPSELRRALVRHSIYASKILVVDPFVHPDVISEKHNPIAHPSMYGPQTLKNVNLYRELLPWIDAGIVEIIRTPGDFDPALYHQTMTEQNAKFERDPKLQASLQESIKALAAKHNDKLFRQQMLLGAPDSYLRTIFRKLGGPKPGLTEDEFIEYVHRQRRDDPDFLEPIEAKSGSGHLHMMFSGAGYEMARLVCEPSGAYMFTDLKVRWTEIEQDRARHSAEDQVWSPFAKSMQSSRLSYLNALNLDHALLLRKEGRLEELRVFLRKVWESARSEEPFSEANAIHLANELTDEVRKAEAEWREIRIDIPKIVGAAVTAVSAAAPFVVEGSAGFAAAAVGAAQVGSVLWKNQKLRRFQRRFPAAFFMDIDEFDGE
jgi:hypothetical protein